MKLEDVPSGAPLLKQAEKSSRTVVAANAMRKENAQAGTSYTIPSVPIGLKMNGSKKYGIRNLRKGAPPYPTVPIAIHLGRVYDPQINEMHEESILWPLGDPALTPQAVAGALCKQVGHSSAEMVGQVQGQIEYALRKFDGYKAGGEMSHADIELHVVYEGHEFKDTVRWYPLEPLQPIEEFAYQTCEDLALPEPMSGLVAQQLRAKVEEARKSMHASAPKNMS